MFRGNIPESGILTRKMYSIQQFDNGFTFAEWFYDIMILTQKYLSDAWKNGLIIGFISKADAETILNTQLIGTFLLRFSDSTRGNSTKRYLCNNSIYGNKWV